MTYKLNALLATSENSCLRQLLIQIAAYCIILSLLATSAHAINEMLTTSSQSLALLILIIISLQVLSAFGSISDKGCVCLQQKWFITLTKSGDGFAFTATYYTVFANYLRMGLAIGLWLYAGLDSMSTLAGEVTNPQLIF